MTKTLILFVAVLPTLAGATRACGADPVRWLTGTALTRALDQPITLVQEQAEVRELVQRLAAVQQTACVLDRRIDPSIPMALTAQQTPLRELFHAAARQAQAECLPLGGTLLIGHAPELDRLVSQSEALQTAMKADRGIPSARRVQLAHDQTLTWRDLDRPADVLAEIERLWSLKVANPELVPHDLWAGGTAAGVDAVQALSLVLGQFELSFRWQPGGQKFEIVPLPARVVIERQHRPPRMSLTEGTEAIRARWPEVVAAPRGAGLSVTATALEHAAISEQLGEVRVAKPVVAAPVPLTRRRFPNVKIVRTPVSVVLDSLAAQGVELDYDAAALADAGIDLEMLVSLEFTNATAEEFLTALCDPVKLSFTIDGSRVSLRPK